MGSTVPNQRSVPYSSDPSERDDGVEGDNVRQHVGFVRERADDFEPNEREEADDARPRSQPLGIARITGRKEVPTVRHGLKAGHVLPTTYTDIVYAAHQPTQTARMARFSRGVCGPNHPAATMARRARTPMTFVTSMAPSAVRDVNRCHWCIVRMNDRSVTKLASRNDALTTPPPVRMNNQSGTERDFDLPASSHRVPVRGRRR